MNCFELKVIEPAKRNYETVYFEWLKTKDNIKNVKENEKKKTFIWKAVKLLWKIVIEIKVQQKG